MSQQQIISLLKKNKEKWFSVKDMMEKIDVGKSSLTKCAKKLRHAGMIDYKLENKRSYTTYYYKWKEKT